MTEENNSTVAPDTPTFPTVQAVLIEASLYAPIPFADEPVAKKALESLRLGNIQIDAHCIYCKRESVFKSMNKTSSGGGAGLGQVDTKWMFKGGRFNVEVNCVRNPVHVYRYNMMVAGEKLIKVGQWPSLEDIAGADIEKYRSQLKDGYFRELKVATGLASHGVGIGSFVYLRRIFERLIYQHHDELDEPIPDFGKRRMDEKIAALKDVLPPALVKNKGAYSILSKGLHELDEKTCQLYFPVVRAAIIQILEQDFQARATAKADDDLAKSIASITQQLK